MSLDGIVLRAVVNELKAKLINGKIDKVYQPEKDELIINIRCQKKNEKLLISASSNNPRIYITNISKPNPQNPPMFCMLLRKHLQGGKILNIDQYSMDRILYFDIESLDELGVKSIKRIIIEIMGKHSNIILIDKNNNTIIDSIKRIPYSVSTVRQILPGLCYELPPSKDKISPLNVSKNEFIHYLEIDNAEKAIFRHIYTTYLGISPLVSKEICYRSNIDPNTPLSNISTENAYQLFNSFYSIFHQIQNNIFIPTIVFDKNENKIIDFSSIDLQQYDKKSKSHFNSICMLLDKYYVERDNFDRIKQKTSDLKKIVQIRLDRTINKLNKQKQELLNASKREKYKIYADLIMANLHLIEKGKSEIELENFYDASLKKVKIKLDPKISPNQNAQKYYKKYNKLKNAYHLLKEHIKKNEDEKKYLEQVLLNIENCTNLTEVNEIREELSEEGFIKKSNKRLKSNKNNSSKPKHFISSDGFDIYVGKNNKQNDYLTLKLSDKEDIWLHTKNIPGSHVIIKSNNSEISKNAILEGALLAAYFSKAKMSSNVPVDYTKRKYVRKPNGAKPGMVIYDNNNTIYVTPSDEQINKILQVED